MLTYNKTKTRQIKHNLHRNSLLKHVIKGKIEGRLEVKGRRGGRRKELLKNERMLEVERGRT